MTTQRLFLVVRTSMCHSCLWSVLSRLFLVTEYLNSPQFLYKFTRGHVSACQPSSMRLRSWITNYDIYNLYTSLFLYRWQCKCRLHPKRYRIRLLNKTSAQQAQCQAEPADLGTNKTSAQQAQCRDKPADLGTNKTSAQQAVSGETSWSRYQQNLSTAGSVSGETSWSRYQQNLCTAGSVSGETSWSRYQQNLSTAGSVSGETSWSRYQQNLSTAGSVSGETSWSRYHNLPDIH
jgi:uncharacterized protein YbcV (DUF1398 family)